MIKSIFEMEIFQCHRSTMNDESALENQMELILEKSVGS